MAQADLPPPMKHLVNDPALQAMAAEAANNVAEAVRCLPVCMSKASIAKQSAVYAHMA